MIEKLDAVLPLARRDLPRSEILRWSLARFFSGLGTCWVVVPDGDLETVRRAIKESGFRVLPESELIPELAFYKALRTVTLRRSSRLGWFVQQIAKLAIASHVESNFFLVLDADVICVRPVSVSDLVKDGRARTKRYSNDVHQEWYLRASALLRLPRSSFTHSVTPCLLSKEGVLQLQAHLSGQVETSLRAMGRFLATPWPRDLLAGWRSYLLRHLGWSEYALYHTFLEATGVWDRYHYEEGATGIAWNSVWQRDDWSTWDPGRSFGGDGNYFFTVVQSNTGVGAAEVWERVARYLAAG